MGCNTEMNEYVTSVCLLEWFWLNDSVHGEIVLQNDAVCVVYGSI